MTNYIIGLLGMWLLCDGIISIRMYLHTDQTWLKDHSIRLVRCAIGIFLIIIGAL